LAISAFLLAGFRVQIAAPEGFSTLLTAPAHTTPGFAGSKPGLLVSIIAFYSLIALDYAIFVIIGQSMMKIKQLAISI